jgi:hypothetical protein
MPGADLRNVEPPDPVQVEHDEAHGWEVADVPALLERPGHARDLEEERERIRGDRQILELIAIQVARRRGTRVGRAERLGGAERSGGGRVLEHHARAVVRDHHQVVAVVLVHVDDRRRAVGHGLDPRDRRLRYERSGRGGVLVGQFQIGTGWREHVRVRVGVEIADAEPVKGSTAHDGGRGEELARHRRILAREQEAHAARARSAGDVHQVLIAVLVHVGDRERIHPFAPGRHRHGDRRVERAVAGAVPDGDVDVIAGGGEVDERIVIEIADGDVLRVGTGVVVGGRAEARLGRAHRRRVGLPAHAAIAHGRAAGVAYRRRAAILRAIHAPARLVDAEHLGTARGRQTARHHPDP